MPIKIKSGEPLYYEIMDFLHDENYELDNGNFRDWIKRFDQENFHYVMPVRTNRERAHGNGFIENMFFFEENYKSMVKRVERLETEFAWAEDPPSRTRRFISNIRIEQISDNTYSVHSYLMVLRSRGNETNFQIISCIRNDILLKSSEGFKIQSREILLDQTTLGTDNLAVFL